MFGYVLPRKDRLPPEAQARYRAGYCGLCRALKRRYGFRARFLVSYDMTFLYFLLQEAQCSPTSCRCPAHPFCRKPCLPDDALMCEVADLSVLLMYWKMHDALQDGTPLHRLGARLALAFYRRPYQRARARQPQADACFSRQLEKLRCLEKTRCASMDRAADAFAEMLRCCADGVQEERTRRSLQVLLYHVGRFLYLVDALEDLPADLRAARYNPLCYRFQLEQGALSAADRALLHDTLEASISLAASALELLPPRADHALVQNIIYYGLPAVLRAVESGTFRKVKKGATDEGPL